MLHAMAWTIILQTYIFNLNYLPSCHKNISKMVNLFHPILSSMLV